LDQILHTPHGNSQLQIKEHRFHVTIGTHGSVSTLRKDNYAAEDLKSSFLMEYFFISLWSCLVVMPAAFAESLIFPLC
jgi:hypothetical protein